MNSLYMIRAFGTGTGFGPQVWLLILALALAGGDGWRHRRGDYGWVLLAGTLTWTAVELTLQLSGMRSMPDRTLLGMSLRVVAADASDLFLTTSALRQSQRFRERICRTNVVGVACGFQRPRDIDAGGYHARTKACSHGRTARTCIHSLGGGSQRLSPRACGETARCC